MRARSAASRCNSSQGTAKSRSPNPNSPPKHKTAYATRPESGWMMISSIVPRSSFSWLRTRYPASVETETDVGFVRVKIAPVPKLESDCAPTARSVPTLGRMLSVFKGRLSRYEYALMSNARRDGCNTGGSDATQAAGGVAERISSKRKICRNFECMRKALCPLRRQIKIAARADIPLHTEFARGIIHASVEPGRSQCRQNLVPHMEPLRQTEGGPPPVAILETQQRHITDGDFARSVVRAARNAHRLFVDNRRRARPQIHISFFAIQVKDEKSAGFEACKNVLKNFLQIFGLHNVVETVERRNDRIKSRRQLEPSRVFEVKLSLGQSPSGITEHALRAVDACDAVAALRQSLRDAAVTAAQIE